jgi:hypothetical protein
MAVKSKNNGSGQGSLLVVVVLFCILIIPKLAQTQNQEFSINPSTHIGGNLKSSYVDGDYAYLIQAEFLTILDISNNQISQISSTQIKDEALSVFVRGNYAYLYLKNNSGFQIVDISDINAPVSGGVCDVPGEFSGTISISGNYVYLISLQNGINIVDISNPLAPNLVNTLDYGNFYSALFIDQDYLYVATGNQFKILDLSDPVNPAESSSTTMYNTDDVFVSGNYAILGHYSSAQGIRIMNVTDKTNPTETSLFITTTGTKSVDINKVSVSDNFVYAASKEDLWLFKIDISDPANPTEISKTEIPFDGYALPLSLQTNDTYVYLGLDSDNGFKKINTSDLSNAGQFECPKDARWTYVYDQRLYVSSSEGFWIYDVSNDWQPVLIKSYPEWSWISRFVVIDHVVYAISDDTYRIINATDANNLFETGSYIFGGDRPHELYQILNYAYLLTGNTCENFKILDVSNPSTITQKGLYTITGIGRDLVIDEASSVAYFVYENGAAGGLLSLDISDPLAPALLKDTATTNAPFCLWKSDQYLFIGSNSASNKYFVNVYDVTNPSLPANVSEYENTGEIWDIQVKNNYVFSGVVGQSIIVNSFDPGSASLAFQALLNTIGSMQFNIGDFTSGSTTIGVSSESKAGQIQPKYKFIPGGGGFITWGIGFPMPNKAILTLSDSPNQASDCASKEDLELVVMNFTLKADDMSAWLVSKIKVHGSGSGNEEDHIKPGKVKLLKGTNVIAESSYDKDDGVVQFAISETIPKGQAVGFSIKYEFNDLECLSCLILDSGDTSAFIDFKTAIKDPKVDISAVALDPVDGSEVLGTASGGPVTLGCIQNKETEKYFKTIQDAVDDDGTVDGHTILVCPGTYTENVDVNKRLTIKSKKGPYKTFVYADKKDESVFYVSKDDCVIEGFTIGFATGAETAGIFYGSQTKEGKIVINDCRIMGNGGSGVYCDGYLHVDDYIECINNGLWGIENEASGIWINSDSLGNPKGQFISKIKDNGRGGIYSDGDDDYGFLNANNLEVINNGHRAWEGDIKWGNGIYADEFVSGSNFKVTHNKRIGIRVSAPWSNLDSDELETGIILKGTDNEISFNGNSGLYTLIADVEIDVCKINNNEGFGIHVYKGNITINELDIETNQPTYPGKISSISDNGKGGLIVEEGDEIEYYTGFVNAHHVEVFRNGLTGVVENVKWGHGIYASVFVGGSHMKVNHNRKSGIKVIGTSHEGENCVSITGDDNEFSYNQYNGIEAGIGSIEIGAAQIINNIQGFGIRVKNGNISINELDIETNQPTYPGKISSISDNGKGGLIVEEGDELEYYAGFVNAHHVEVFRNGLTGVVENVKWGHGIYASVFVGGSHMKVNHNRKSGIKVIGTSYEDKNCVAITGEDNEFSYNQYHGIEAIIGIVEVGASQIINNDRGFGIVVKHGDININELDIVTNEPTYPVTSRIAENGKGGLFAGDIGEDESGHINANKVEVRNNGLSGVVDKASWGHGLYADTYAGGCYMKITGNKKSGIFVLGPEDPQGAAVFIYGQENDISDNRYYGIYTWGGIIKIERADVHHNDSWGIYSKTGGVSINTGNNITGHIVHSRLSRINYNGRGGIGTFDRFRIKASPIVANYLEAKGNGKSAKASVDKEGHGVASNAIIILNDSKIINNKKYGIYTTADAKLKQVEVSGNKQGGILIDKPLSQENSKGQAKITFKNDQTVTDAFCIGSEFSSIQGAVIEQNEGDGIYIVGDKTLNITESNIVNNQNYAINNLGVNSIIQAHNNWWGDTNGPVSGAINGTVDVLSWLQSPVALIISSAVDTIFVPASSSDSVYCYFQNWENPNDVVDVSITDLKGWYTGAGNLSLAFQDSLGAKVSLKIDVPAGTPEGTVNRFNVSAVSQSNSQWTDSDSFEVVSYESNLEKISVSPDSLVISLDKELSFTASGYDKKNKLLEFTPIWKSSSGAINNNGLFIPDTTQGVIEITATDTVSQIQGKAYVRVKLGDFASSRIHVYPDSIQLGPGEEYYFKASGYDEFGFSFKLVPVWKTIGGVIDSSGYYKAGEEPGIYYVTATDTTAQVEGKAIVIIQPITGIEENEKIQLTKYKLYQNYPNPFNPETTIQFDVIEQTMVELKIFDILGREVKILVKRNYNPGSHKVTFDASKYASGMYIMKIKIGNFQAVKKMMVLK